jgi:hypothetical protein
MCSASDYVTSGLFFSSDVSMNVLLMTYSEKAMNFKRFLVILDFNIFFVLNGVYGFPDTLQFNFLLMTFWKK